MNSQKCLDVLESQSEYSIQNICAKCFQLQANDSPLQINTRGEVDAQHFRVIGCKKWMGQRGSWLEWLVLFDNSKLGLIKEYQGNWSFSELDNKVYDGPSFDPHATAPGETLDVNQKKFTILRTQIIQLDFQNGESLSNDKTGEKQLLLEGIESNKQGSSFRSLAFQFSLDASQKAIWPPALNLGREYNFEEYKFKDLRDFKANNRIQKINCPSCSGIFILRHRSISLRAICHSCHHIIDVSSDDLMSLRSLDLKFKFDPIIPIGSIGKFQGEEFEVIGCIKWMSQNQPTHETTQYLLYSPTKSYRWLNTDHGHWTFIRPVKDLDINWNETNVNYRGQKYSFDHRSERKLIFAIGEFFWPIQKDEIYESLHFVSPPFELSLEKSQRNSPICLGKYLTPRQVSNTFGLIHTLPNSSGSIAHEVSPFHHLVKEFLLINFIFLIVCFLIQLRSQNTDGIAVHKSRIHFTSNTEERLQSTEPFELRGGPGMLAISIASPGNSQSKVESNLVEIQSKKKYSFKLTTNSKDFLIPAISQGFYLINFNRGESSENLSFEVSVVYGAKSWSNFFLLSILMSIPTLVVLVLNFKFETQRKKRKILGAGEN